MQKKLNEVAKALDTLARYGLLYGGFRSKLRRVVEVRATSTQLVIKYEDGDVYYIDQSVNRRFTVYTHPPQQQQ
ncbi:MAG: hypothetical protein ACO2PN_27140 [Pyrobaculum sp.]|jgi:hypothetical protein